MEKHEFIREIEKMKPLISGKGKLIADSAEISYFQYSNYLKGAGSDPAIMNKILIACRNEIKRMQALAEDII